VELLPELAQPKSAVLVVDDDPLILKAVARVLRSRFEVMTAEGAGPARAAVEGRRICLVLSDYSMPDEDGLSLIRSLRSAGNVGTAALVTAVSESEEIRVALRAGQVQRVIPKPWSPLELLRNALELARLGGA
jgi:CheY-like chemotaxis protein